jgi:hypothetical protein
MPYNRRCDRILLGRNKGGETKHRGCTFVGEVGDRLLITELHNVAHIRSARSSFGGLVGSKARKNQGKA